MSGAKDLTVGPIGPTLIAFTLPVLGSNVLHSLNGTANAAWVSHVLGEGALAAVSNANNILFLMLGAAFGISMAANLMISQAVGAADEALAKKVIGTSVTFFAALSLAVGVLGWLLTPAVLSAMQTPPGAYGQAVTYLRVIFLAMPFMYFFSFVMMAMRGTGDSKTPFYFSAFAVGLDIVLNPLLIIGPGPLPGFGIAGSAAATLISQTVTLFAMIAYLYRKGSVLALTPPDWPLLKPDLQLSWNLALKGAPMAVQMLVISGAAIVLMAYVNALGLVTAAAYGAALQLWTYVQMPAMALGAAVSSMAAQNVGAGKMDRVDQVALTGSLYAAIITAVPILAIFALEGLALRLFLPEGSPATPLALRMNLFVLWGFVPFGIAFVLSGIVRATGAVYPPLIAMVISLWIVRIPFVHFMLPVMGPDAIWISFPLGSLVSCLLGAAYYRWGGWRKASLMGALGPRGQAGVTGLATPAMAPAAGDGGTVEAEPLGVSRREPESAG